MIAAGEIDIYWDAGCYAWDVAVRRVEPALQTGTDLRLELL